MTEAAYVEAKRRRGIRQLATLSLLVLAEKVAEN
jgi:hypothetical protein